MVSKTSRSSESKTFSQPSVNHEKLENIDQIKKYLRYEVGWNTSSQLLEHDQEHNAVENHESF